MAKSMRSKREKRLRAIRREIVEPFYEKKDEAKFAAQEAALAAPKLPVRSPKTNSMEIATPTATSTADNNMGKLLISFSFNPFNILFELLLNTRCPVDGFQFNALSLSSLNWVYKLSSFGIHAYHSFLSMPVLMRYLDFTEVNRTI